MRFTRQQHLRHAIDFQTIRITGTRRECGFFYLNILIQSDRNPPLRRAGFIASRRVGNAVARNRAKRLMRETFRLHQAALPPSCDVVMVARTSILKASLPQITERFLKAVKDLS